MKRIFLTLLAVFFAVVLFSCGTTIESASESGALNSENISESAHTAALPVPTLPQAPRL